MIMGTLALHAHISTTSPPQQVVVEPPKTRRKNQRIKILEGA